MVAKLKMACVMYEQRVSIRAHNGREIKGAYNCTF